MRLEYISRSDIEIGARGRKKYDNLEGLTADMGQRGMISPVAVLDLKASGAVYTIIKPYLLLAGGRRMRCAEILDMNTVPAHIYDHELSQQEMRAIELSENIHREDLAWDEKITMEKEIHDLMVSIHGEKVAPTPDAPGWSQADTAHMLNISPATLSRDIQLATSIEVIPELRGVTDKTTARKMVEAAGRSIIRSEKANVLEKQHATGDADLKKKELINSYFIFPPRPDILSSGFFEGIQKIDDNSVHLIELDPPYAIALQTARKSEDGSSKTTLSGYNEIAPKLYPDFIKKMLTECYRVLRPGGWIINWFAPDPWFPYVSNTLTEVGFVGKAMPGIWAKGMGQSNRPDLYLGSTYEMFFYYRKGEARLNLPGRGNIFSFKSVPPSTKIHPTERPIEMIMEILRTFCDAGSIIMVPCLGSGNTLLAAHNLGMNSFGYEVEKSYRDSFIIRVNDGVVGDYKSYKQEKE